MSMKTLLWRSLAIGLLSFSFASAAQAPGIDPALLAKANAGDAPAQLAVGVTYERGDGAKPDYAQAESWYRRAAIQNNSEAQIRLAALYRDGRGVKRDVVEAAAWYRKAADSGNVIAQGTLGILYSVGQGVPHSDVDAYYWLALAAAVTGPEQEKYAANRQSMAARITADELADAQDRVAKWVAAHPRP
jgi:uncharacterized protein